VRRKGDILVRACRAAGLPVTLQRRAVYQALAARSDHPTIDEVHEDVRRTSPAVSRTTVCRVLETLTGIGLAQRVLHPDLRARYEARVERHHHFVCDRCGTTLDVQDARLDDLPIPPGPFEVRTCCVYLRGLCGACRDTPLAATAGPARGGALVAVDGPPRAASVTA
jgi:Fur family peroxide stress response transcriptional regulator